MVVYFLKFESRGGVECQHYYCQKLNKSGQKTPGFRPWYIHMYTEARNKWRFICWRCCKKLHVREYIVLIECDRSELYELLCNSLRANEHLDQQLRLIQTPRR